MVFIYSRNNLPKTKDEPCVINLDEFKSVGFHWIDLYVNDNNIIFLTYSKRNVEYKHMIR